MTVHNHSDTAAIIVSKLSDSWCVSHVYLAKYALQSPKHLLEREQMGCRNIQDFFACICRILMNRFIFMMLWQTFLNGQWTLKLENNIAGQTWLTSLYAWVKFCRIIPEFRILRLTFHRKSAPKSWIRQILMASFIWFQFIQRQLTI